MQLMGFRASSASKKSYTLMASTQAIPDTGNELGQTVHMLLVLRNKSGIFVLQLIELLVSDSGAMVMRKLQQRLNQDGALKSKVRRAVYCRRIIVDIAEISLVGYVFSSYLSASNAHSSCSLPIWSLA